MRLVFAFVGVSLLTGRMFAQALITLTPNGSNPLRTVAHDAALSPPGSRVEQDRMPASVPFSAQGRAVDGTSSSTITYSLSDTDLNLSFEQSHGSTAGSFANVLGSIIFRPNYDLHYESSGVYSALPSSVWMEEAVSLQGGGVLQFMDGQQNQNFAPNGGFRLGGDGQGAEFNGSLSGSLFSGTTYVLAYNYYASVNAQGQPAITANGSLDVQLSLRGDLNGDRSVGFDDLVILAAHYGQTGNYYRGDIDGSGTVDFEDLVIIAHSYGVSVPSPVQPAAVPDPVATVLVVGLYPILKRDRS